MPHKYRSFLLRAKDNEICGITALGSFEPVPNVEQLLVDYETQIENIKNFKDIELSEVEKEELHKLVGRLKGVIKLKAKFSSNEEMSSYIEFMRRLAASR